jgi:hypothetical protein
MAALHAVLCKRKKRGKALKKANAKLVVAIDEFCSVK